MFLDDISPSAITLTFDANTRSFRNPINRKDQFAKLQGDRWRATLSFNNLNQSEADAYVAWIMSLNGQVGTFNCPVVTQTLTSVVTVTSSTTSTVSVDNVGQLKAGKYFSSNGELKAITSISGTVISFKPNFRAQPVVGQRLMVNKPIFRARLDSDNISIIASSAEQTNGQDIYQSFKVSAVEDL
jgi:hypothetical protein